MSPSIPNGRQVREIIERGGGLLNQTQVGELLGYTSSSTTAWRVNTAGFPRPVAAGGHKQTKLWLRADVENWKRLFDQRHGR